MTICDVCQTPIGEDDVQEETVAGEPAHSDCLEAVDELEDIAPGDVEGVREDLLEQVPDDAPEKYRAAWIDAVIAFDRRLTDPGAVRDDVDEPAYGVTD